MKLLIYIQPELALRVSQNHRRPAQTLCAAVSVGNLDHRRAQHPLADPIAGLEHLGHRLRLHPVGILPHDGVMHRGVKGLAQSGNLLQPQRHQSLPELPHHQIHAGLILVPSGGIHRFFHIVQTGEQPGEQLRLGELSDLLLFLLGAALVPVLSAFYGLVQECASGEVLLSGQMNLLRHPDYELENARSLMSLLDERSRLGHVLALQPEDGLQVVLGSDKLPELNGSSIITTHYSLGQRGQGTIGIIGPIRMNYADTIPRIEYFANAIGKLLSELFDDE